MTIRHNIMNANTFFGLYDSTQSSFGANIVGNIFTLNGTGYQIACPSLLVENTRFGNLGVQINAPFCTSVNNSPVNF